MEEEKLRPRYTFCEEISNLKIRGNELNAKEANGHLLTYKMIIQINVLGASMGDWIGRHGDCIAIIAENCRGSRERNSKIEANV